MTALFWVSILALALTVESWSSTVPMALVVLAYVALMTGVAVRYSHE